MQVRVLRTFLSPRAKKFAHEGDVMEMDERRARILSERVPPLVTIDLGPGTPRQQWTPEEQEGADAGSLGPTQIPPTGGPTGEAKPASSSRRGRPRQTPASSERGGARGSSR